MFKAEAMRSIAVIFALLLGILVGSWEILSADDPKPMLSQRVVPLETWIRELQSIGAKYKPGKTAVENNASIDALVEEIAESQEGRRIRFAATLKNITWKDGLATISFSTSTDKSSVPSNQMPLRINRFGDWQIKVDQKTALALKPQMNLVFEGTVKFHPWRSGAVGTSNNAQQLHSMSHDKLNSQCLGTFTTQDYEITINGKSYEGRWQKAK